MQTKLDFAGSTDKWSTSAGGHLMKVVNLTGFTVYVYCKELTFPPAVRKLYIFYRYFYKDRHVDVL